MRLSQRTYVCTLLCLQRHLQLRARSQSRHSCVINVVIITKAVPSFQVRPCGLSRCLCRPHLRIIFHPVFQLPPLDMDSAFINFFTQRFRLKSFVKLRQRRYVREVGFWKGYGCGCYIRLFRSFVKINRWRRSILPIQYRCCPAKYSEQDQPY